LKLVVRAGTLVGERNIDARTCEDLAGATAVVLALLLRSEVPLRDDELAGGKLAGIESPVGIESPAGIENSASGPPLTSSTDRDEQARTSLSALERDALDPQRAPAPKDGVAPGALRRWHGVLQLPVVSMGIGPVPGVSLGLSLAAGFSFARWSLLAESGAWLKQTLTVVDQPDAGADIHRIEAAVRGCRAIPLGRLEVSACLRAALQHMWARGTGVHVAPETAQTSWLAAGLGVQAHYQFVRSFRIFGGLDVNFQAARPRLSIDSVGSLGQLWPAALTISVGSEWIL
jgi:hypothetical protein